MGRQVITVAGIKEFQKALRKLDADMPKLLRVAFNQSSELVIGYAKPKVPRRSGAAASSLKVRSSQREARIAAGGRKAPYYAWLDFGGRVGRGGSVVRPFLTQGRYIYPGLAANREQITSVMSASLADVARQAGVEVA